MTPSNTIPAGTLITTQYPLPLSAMEKMRLGTPLTASDFTDEFVRSELNSTAPNLVKNTMVMASIIYQYEEEVRQIIAQQFLMQLQQKAAVEAAAIRAEHKNETQQEERIKEQLAHDLLVQQLPLDQHLPTVPRTPAGMLLAYGLAEVAVQVALSAQVHTHVAQAATQTFSTMVQRIHSFTPSLQPGKVLRLAGQSVQFNPQSQDPLQIKAQQVFAALQHGLLPADPHDPKSDSEIVRRFKEAEVDFTPNIARILGIITSVASAVALNELRALQPTLAPGALHQHTKQAVNDGLLKGSVNLSQKAAMTSLRGVALMSELKTHNVLRSYLSSQGISGVQAVTIAMQLLEMSKADFECTLSPDQTQSYVASVAGALHAKLEQRAIAEDMSATGATAQLQSIATFASGMYSTNPLRMTPQPKPIPKTDAEDEQANARLKSTR